MNLTYSNNPNANYFQQGQGGNPTGNISNSVSSIPMVPSTIDASAVQSPRSLNLGSMAQLSPVPNIANLTSSEAIKPIQTTPVAPVVPTTNSWTDKLTSLFGQSKNQAIDTAVAVDTATSPYNQQLNELNTQIKMQQANAIANQEKAMRAGETTGFASREAQNIARTDAIETLKLSALAEGMRGNIALATQHATQAVEAKYAEMNKQIEDAKTNIYNNYDSFSASEKKKADQTLLRLNAQDAFAKANMENEKATQAVIQTAIKQGAENGVPVPSLILSQVSKLTDPTQATQLLAPYLKDAASIQAKIDAHNTALAQQAKIYQDMALNKEDRAQKLKEQAQTVVIDPVTNKPTSELKINAREAASTLLNKVITGKGTSAVGGSRIFGLQYIPGTNAADFKVQFDNLKSLLSLDNVRLLKGQGAVSDAERALLAAASSNLNLSQSDSEFKKNLIKISIGLGNPQEVTLTDKQGISKKVPVNADTLNQAISDGLTVTY